MTAPGVWLCTQSPRLPSVAVPGKNIRKHEKRERLSAAGWVKRTYGRGARPAIRSGSSIASTPHRVALLADPSEGLADQVRALHTAASRVTDLVTEEPVCDSTPQSALPLATQLGTWVYPEVWDLEGLRREYRTTATEDVVRSGRAASRGRSSRLGDRLRMAR